MKNNFYFTSKAFFILKMFKFLIDFSVVYWKGLIKKIKVNLKF